jgi:hypothetical protein
LRQNAEIARRFFLVSETVSFTAADFDRVQLPSMDPTESPSVSRRRPQTSRSDGFRTDNIGWARAAPKALLSPIRRRVTPRVVGLGMKPSGLYERARRDVKCVVADTLKSVNPYIKDARVMKDARAIRAPRAATPTFCAY